MDQDLSPAEALRFARHISTCTACRIVLAREARLSAMLHEMADPCAVDESFFKDVMAALPERPANAGVRAARRERFRRGLRLASWGAIAATVAGLAGRVVPSLRLDLAPPTVPRFAPDEADRWISILGAAAQWARMTAESIAWAGSSNGFGTWASLALPFGAALAALAALACVSGALAWAARTRSRPS